MPLRADREEANRHNLGINVSKTSPVSSNENRDFVLITYEGGVLVVDPASNSLQQRGFSTPPDILAVGRISAESVVSVRGLLAETAVVTGRFVESIDGSVGLRTAEGGFVCASPHLGPVSDASVRLDEWERLLVVSMADYDLLRRFAQSRWVIDSDPNPTARDTMTLLRGFKILFGGRECSLPDILECLRAGSDGARPLRLPKSFTCLDGLCTPMRAFLYEPVIYATTGGADHFFDQLAQCFSSIRRFGNYDGHYVLVSNRQDDEVEACFTGIDRNKWTHLSVEVNDVPTIVTMRRDILHHELFEQYQPILYLDSDIICDRPLEEMLADLVRSDKIFMTAEYAGRSIADVDPAIGNWFGQSLYRPDDPAYRAHHCINCGIFGARNREILIGPLDLVGRAWSRYRMQFPGSHAIAFDQPFFSYVLQTLGLVDVELLAGWATILNVSEPAARLVPGGLAHFNLGVGMDKTAAMRRYTELLEHGAAPAQASETTAVADAPMPGRSLS